VGKVLAKDVPILAFCACHRTFCKLNFFEIQLLADLILGMQWTDTE